MLAAPAQADYWVQADPSGPAEGSLQAAAQLPDRAARMAALTALASSQAGSASAGLAWLDIGLEHLAAGRFAEAENALQQPDLKRTALADRALLTLARTRDERRQHADAARTYMRVLDEYAGSPLLCDALSGAADAWSRGGERDRARPLLERVLDECPGWEPSALLRLGQYYEAKGRLQEAADHYDRADCDYPSSPRSAEAAKRLTALRGKVPALPAAVRFQRDLRKAAFLSDEGRHREVAPLLRSLLARTPPSLADGEIVRMRLARALIALDKDTEALRLLEPIAPTSVFAPEAVFLRARAQAERTRRPQPYDAVTTLYPRTEWAEEALLSQANFYLKDARVAEAAPYFQRLLSDFPDGRYLERATWWAGWWEYLSGRIENAAAILESGARKRPDSLSTAGALYWAGRAQQRLGNADKSRELFEATVRRFKHTYHGLRAAEALGLLRAGASSTHPAETTRSDGRSDVPEPFRQRVRQLLLIERYAEAMSELQRVPGSAQAQATQAWIHWKQGRIRPAITTMRRAYPDWRSEAGDRLPLPVWRILYPLHYERPLVARAGDEGLDASLVAALIWQESAFDPQAKSPVGALGLMQLMPKTARSLARRLGDPRFKTAQLTDPPQNLKLGALYLKDMIDRFGGRVERALAAYNAGPTRVVRWTSGPRVISAEEFIESIPFSETRTYVMNVLSHREQYRRLYSLPVRPGPGLLPDSALATSPAAAGEEVAPARKAPAKKAASVRKGSKSRKASASARKKTPARKRARAPR